MPRKDKLIMVRHGSDGLLFSSSAGLTRAQQRVLRSLTRALAVREFGEAKVLEAEQTGLALIVGCAAPSGDAREVH